MKNNRVKYVIAGALMLLFLGTIYAWSYFKASLAEIFPI